MKRTRLLIEAGTDERLRRLGRDYEADSTSDNAESYGRALKRAGDPQGKHLIVKHELDAMRHHNRESSRAYDSLASSSGEQLSRVFDSYDQHNDHTKAHAKTLRRKLRDNNISPHSVVRPEDYQSQHEHLIHLAHAYGLNPHGSTPVMPTLQSGLHIHYRGSSKAERKATITAHRAKIHSFMASAKGHHPDLNIRIENTTSHISPPNWRYKFSSYFHHIDWD